MALYVRPIYIRQSEVYTHRSTIYMNIYPAYEYIRHIESISILSISICTYHIQ